MTHPWWERVTRKEVLDVLFPRAMIERVIMRGQTAHFGVLDDVEHAAFWRDLMPPYMPVGWIGPDEGSMVILRSTLVNR